MRCLLTDKITALEKNVSITGIKNVTMSENFLADHFPGFPVMPGVLQLEAVSQLGSWLVFASSDYKKKAGLSSIKSIKYKEFVVPGEQMRIEIKIKTYGETEAAFDAEIYVGEKLKTQIKKGVLTFIEIADLEDPQKAKTHFDFITGNTPKGAYGG